MRKYIKSLDGLRGLGILFVVLYHFLRLKGYDWTTMGFAWIWLQMFFIQSGYLITQILLNSRQYNLTRYLKRFYWRRILRIFPLYFGYILLFTFFYLLFSKPQDFLERLPYLVTYTYNFTRFIPEIEFNSVFFMHFWSLAVEEQFYLFWPFVIYFLNQKQLRFVLAVIVVVTPFIRMILGNVLLAKGFDAQAAGEIIYAFTFSQFDAFALGAAIPIFKLDEKIKKAGIFAILSIALVLSIGIANYNSLVGIFPEYSWTSFGYAIGEMNNYQHVWSYTVINVMFSFIIIYLIKADYKGIFNSRFFVSPGKVVYGMYIFHFVIIFLIMKLSNRLIDSMFMQFCFIILITYLLAYFSYYKYEKVFLEFKDRV